MAQVDAMNRAPAEIKEKKQQTFFQPVWVVTGASVVLFTAHLYLRSQSGSLKDGLDPIALGLIALALLPWITSLIEYFKFGGFEFRLVSQKVDEQQRDIEALQFLFANFLTKYELEHLRKLDEGTEFKIDTNKYADEFKREIRRLRDLRLIDNYENKGIRTMYAEPGQIKDVQKYFFVTRQGRDYLTMLKNQTGSSASS